MYLGSHPGKPLQGGCNSGHGLVSPSLHQDFSFQGLRAKLNLPHADEAPFGNGTVVQTQAM